MVKLTRGQEVKTKMQRLLSEELKRRKKLIFPNCIGLFPDDCKDVNIIKIGLNCKKCPYYSEVNRKMELNNLNKLSAEEVRKKFPGIVASIEEGGETVEQYLDRVKGKNKKESIKKEEIVVKSTIKQLNDEEYEKHLRETLSEEGFNKWKESKEKIKVEEAEKPKKIRRKRGIANEIRLLVLSGVVDENKIYESIKEKFADRTKEYLEFRIFHTLKYLKSRGEVK